MKAKKPQRPRCHNCKFAGEPWKGVTTTEMHCEGPHYGEAHLDEDFSPWETVREWWDTCEHHQFKEPAAEAVQQ